ncbi:MAG: 26S proteasome regulatory subunit 6A [Cercozoa sp. M6MM]
MSAPSEQPQLPGDGQEPNGNKDKASQMIDDVAISNEDDEKQAEQDRLVQEQKEAQNEAERRIEGKTPEEIDALTRMLRNNERIMKQEVQRHQHRIKNLEKELEDAQKKLKQNKQLPYLVSNVVEVLDIEAEQQTNEAVRNTTQQGGKAVVIKTSQKQTIFLPVVGLVDPNELSPNDLVGVNKDSYLILDKLPEDFDSRVKAMEVEEKPSESWSDVGGCDAQIRELQEAIVLPMTHPDRFRNIGISPPKGCLMHGPPGTGKTMMARACASETNACFLKVSAPQLVQMYIGDGAKMVRDAFKLGTKKAPAIIFIDEIDAIGGKRFDSDKSGDREVQRTMLELLNQLDGFSQHDQVKVIAATNRPDILDPALLRSGRLDRKIEFPLPSESGREQILQIHAKRMVLHPDISWGELARSTQDFNGAQLKAVCVEAGMDAMREGQDSVMHENFINGILTVQQKKKSDLAYFA